MGYCEYLVQPTHIMTSKLLQNYVNKLRGSSCDIVLMHSTLTYLGSPQAVWYLNLHQQVLRVLSSTSSGFQILSQKQRVNEHSHPLQNEEITMHTQQPDPFFSSLADILPLKTVECRFSEQFRQKNPTLIFNKTFTLSKFPKNKQLACPAPGHFHRI